MTIELEDLKKVKLEPGDVVVWSMPTPVTNAMRDALYPSLHDMFPNNKFILLNPGETLQVVAKETP